MTARPRMSCQGRASTPSIRMARAAQQLLLLLQVGYSTLSNVEVVRSSHRDCSTLIAPILPWHLMLNWKLKGSQHGPKEHDRRVAHIPAISKATQNSSLHRAKSCSDLALPSLSTGLKEA